MSKLLDSVLGFKDLTPTQIVAFILGIVFTILAVAGVLFAYRFAGKIKSRMKIVVATMVLPFIAIASWLILIFSFLNGFRQDDLMNIFVSLALSLVICFMILMISYILYQKHRDTLEAEGRLEEVEKAEEEEAEKGKPAAPLALPENVDAQETTDEATEVVAEDTQEVEPTDEVEETETLAAEETVEAEETEQEETIEDAAEEETQEEAEETVEDVTEEPVEETVETEEDTEPAEVDETETTDETVIETADEEVEESTDDTATETIDDTDDE